MTELKPCPFCGGNAKTYFDVIEKGLFSAFVVAKTQCADCGARISINKSVEDLSTCNYEQDLCNLTVKMWNRRVNNG